MAAGAELGQLPWIHNFTRRGYAVIDSPVPKGDFRLLASSFDELVQGVGPKVLTKTTQTANVTGRLGGTYGFFQKPPDVDGSGKRFFTFRTVVPHHLDFGSSQENRKGVPQQVREFIEQGQDLLSTTTAAMRKNIAELDEQYPGLLAVHFGRQQNWRDGVDADMRIVSYDPASDPQDVVLAPHRDLASFVGFWHQQPQGGMFVINEATSEPSLRFPLERFERQGVIFTGCRLQEVYPAFPATPVWHGGIADGGIDNTRRVIISTQVHPRLDIPLDLEREEAYPRRNAPTVIKDAFADGIRNRQRRFERDKANVQTVSGERRFMADPTQLIPNIFHYRFPEVRESLRGLTLEPNFLLHTNYAHEAAAMLDPFNFEPEFVLPLREDGTVILDSLYEQGVERIHEQVKGTFPGLNAFDNRYPLQGSYDAIGKLLNDLIKKKKFKRLAILEGEYGGYKKEAEKLGIADIEIVTYQSFKDAVPNDEELWFVTNPSARDGNYIDPTAWAEFINRGHKIVYDAAYAGVARGATIDVSSPNILAVMTSPSKTFGVFHERGVGIAYTREPADSFRDTHNFTSISELLKTVKLYETFPPNELSRQYRARQEEICEALSQRLGVAVIPSDVLVVAHATGKLPKEYDEYLRGDNYRLGLARLFEDRERIDV